VEIILLPSFNVLLSSSICLHWIWNVILILGTVAVSFERFNVTQKSDFHTPFRWCVKVIHITLCRQYNNYVCLYNMLLYFPTVVFSSSEQPKLKCTARQSVPVVRCNLLNSVYSQRRRSLNDIRRRISILGHPRAHDAHRKVYYRWRQLDEMSHSSALSRSECIYSNIMYIKLSTEYRTIRTGRFPHEKYR